MSRVNPFRKASVALITVAATSLPMSAAYAQCGCAVGETRYRPGVAHAEALLQQNVKKTVIATDTKTFHSPQCWAITNFNVAEIGLGTTGTFSWSSYPSNVNYMSSGEFSQAHQAALDWLVDVGYQGQSLVNAQLAVNESYSNMQSQMNALQSSHSGVTMTAQVKGRGRLTWKGRELAGGTLNVTETCVPDGFKSGGDAKTLITQNANLPPKPVKPLKGVSSNNTLRYDFATPAPTRINRASAATGIEPLKYRPYKQ